MEDNGKYFTSDAALAAYLIYKEVKLLAVEFRNGWGLFVFEDIDNSTQVFVVEFYTSNGSVPPRTYFRKYKDALALLKDKNDQ